MANVDPSVDPALDLEVRAFLEQLNAGGGPPLEELPPLEARQVLVKAQASVKVDLSGIEVSERTISAGGMSIKLDIVRPAAARGVLPVFVFVHGGGWVLGDYPTHERLVRDLVVMSGHQAVFVDYTRTPDARFPRALDEIYAATKWVSEHGRDIGADGNRLAIVGNSVGGNMATVTTLMAKERGGPKIRSQVLMWPVADAGFDTESYRQFGEKRFLTAPLIKWMFDLYVPDAAERKNIHVSPLKASVVQLEGLPPALIQVAENDILRDEGEAYGRKLNEAGVEVTTVRYLGVIHDFGLLNGLAELPATRAHLRQAATELREHLE
jgi:acetyl esterase/lipase